MHHKKFGVFETVRIENGKAVLIDYHYARLCESVKLLGIPFNFSVNKFKELLEKDSKGTILRKFTLYEDGSFLIEERPVKKRNSVSLIFVEEIKRCYSKISSIKTTDIANSLLALKLANQRGGDEALLLSTNGFISETAFANVFFVKGETFYTPSLRTGCLNGTRRRFILDLVKKLGINLIEGYFTLSDLYDADEVFITSARDDAVIVSRINEITFEIKGKTWASRIKEVIAFSNCFTL